MDRSPSAADRTGLWPAPVNGVARRLAEAGHRSWLVGEGLHRALLGSPGGPFEIWTSAAAEDVASSLAEAVCIATAGGAFAVPTQSGPVDVVPLAAGSRGPAAALGHRAFTIHAGAWDWQEGILLDPFDGRADWRDGCLRCPGNALDRLLEHPARVWQALRCVSEAPLAADDALRAALVPTLDAMRPSHALAARRALLAWLALDDPTPGLALARASGLEARLAPGASADTALRWRNVPAPRALRTAARLAMWLHGAPASDFLRRFRMGEPLSSVVLRLVAHHPIEQAARPSSDASVGRLERRLEPDELGWLIHWRRIELADLAADHPARGRLAALEAALARTAEARERKRRRSTLALDGAAVMDLMGWGPGPRVGRALRALSDWVAEHPERNRREDLEQRLRAWAREPSS